MTAQVFSFSGYVEHAGSDAVEQSGFARAWSLEQLVSSFAGWGFKVTAASELGEINEAVAAMSAIADGTIPDEDFVDLTTVEGQAPWPADKVFQFVGHPMGAVEHEAFGGFALATNQQSLKLGLANLRFDVDYCLSLADMLSLQSALSEAASSDDLLDLTELA